MPVPEVGLFNWLFENSPKAEYNLGFSNMAGVEYDEFVRLTGHFRMSYALPTEKLGKALERLGMWMREL